MADEILLPPSRLVWGSLYEGQTKTFGKAILNKDGSQGTEYAFGVAVPKGPEAHWKDTPWGAPIWALGHVRIPHAGQLGDKYAWKVKDGDSTEISDIETGRKFCESEGYAKHWIVTLKSRFAPKVYRLNAQNKAEPWLQKDAINPGDFIECLIDLQDNGHAEKPGVFLNHRLVCFAGYGQRIVKQGGPNPDAVGFGARGMVGSATPLSSGAVSAGSVSAPAASHAHVAAPAADAGVPTAPMVPESIEPHTAILNPEPPAPAHVMTAMARGATYEAFVAKGWTDEKMIAAGYMLA